MKQGYIKTLEAVIAVIMVLVFVYILTPQAQKKDDVLPVDIHEVQKFVLEEVALNATYRNCITTSGPGSCDRGGCLSEITGFLQKHTPAGYESACEVCMRAISCSSLRLPLDRSIYTDSVFIGHTQSRVFRVYLWPRS